MSNDQFETVTHAWGQSLAHKTLPVWVVHYPRTKATGEYWQGYIAIAKLIPGRHPCMGGVDNRRVGDQDGFIDIESACAAAIAAGGAV